MQSDDISVMDYIFNDKNNCNYVIKIRIDTVNRFLDQNVRLQIQCM